MPLILWWAGSALALATLVATAVGVFASGAGGRYWFFVGVVFVTSIVSCTSSFRMSIGREYKLRPAPFPESVARFDGFPIYWLGEQYQGLPLTMIYFAPAERDIEAYVLLGYGGTCESRLIDSGPCSDAIRIRIERVCKARDVQHPLSAGHSWTSDVVVTISGPRAPSADQLSLANPEFFARETFQEPAALLGAWADRCWKTATPPPWVRLAVTPPPLPTHRNGTMRLRLVADSAVPSGDVV